MHQEIIRPRIVPFITVSGLFLKYTSLSWYVHSPSGTAIDGGEGCVVVAVVIIAVPSGGRRGCRVFVVCERKSGRRDAEPSQTIQTHHTCKPETTKQCSHREKENPRGGNENSRFAYCGAHALQVRNRAASSCSRERFFSRLLRVFVFIRLRLCEANVKQEPFFHRHQHIRLQPPPMTMPAIRRIWNWRVAAIEARYASYRGLLRQRSRSLFFVGLWGTKFGVSEPRNFLIRQEKRIHFPTEQGAHMWCKIPKT
jgi:hypothetical protein